MENNKLLFIICIGLLITIWYLIYVEHANEEERKILTDPILVSIAIILPLGFPALALYSYVTVNINKK